MRDALVERLDVSRSNGFVVELHPPPLLLNAMLHLLGRGQQLRRAEQIRTSLAAVEAYLPAAIEAGVLYEVSTISAPVIIANGTVSIALELVGFDDRLDGLEVRRLGGLVRAAADDLAAHLDADGA